MKTLTGARLSSFALVLFALIVSIGPAAAQIPDEFTNLKVLPKDIGRDDMVSLMRDFSSALGVRCKFCHLGESEDSLEGYDFASDEPKHKQIARGMMQMTSELNGKLLPQTGLRSPAPVRCVTCHHGLAEPQTIDRLLMEVIEEDGVDAAAERYKTLREEYYGTGAYNFGPGPMNSLVETLAEDKQDVKSALVMMKLHVETNADSVVGHLMLARLYMASNEHRLAVQSVSRALELEPDNPHAQRMLSNFKIEE